MTELLGRALTFGDVDQIKELKRIAWAKEKEENDCPKCEGEGVVEEDCFHCDGSGKETNDCRDCDGTGEKPKKGDANGSH